MSVRIEIELTSARPDESWTWRKAGAQKPKGVVAGSLLPSGSKVGDVLRVEAEIDLDGVEILSVLPSKGSRREPELLEILGSGREFQPVVSILAPKRERSDRDRSERRDRDRRPDGERGPRRDRPAGERGPRPDGERGPRRDRPAGERGPRPDGDRPRRDRPVGERRERPPRPELPAKPKPKRLRPGRTHVNAVLSELPAEHRPIAEQVLRAGVAGVRQAIEDQNKVLAGEGKPTINSAALVDLAQELLPRLRVAEWRDRAEAALAGVDELDLRDLRSVVAASNDAARDEETRTLASQLRDALSARQDRDQATWITEITTELDAGRSIRALRLSSRPPKAGVPFPSELAGRLAAAVSATLTAEAAFDRWLAALDALAFSPVRAQVVPAGIPSAPSDELKAAVAKLSGSIPEIARAFGIEPATAPARPARGPRRPGSPTGPKPIPPKPTAPVAAAPAAPAEAVDAPTEEAPAAEAPVEDAPATDAPVAEAPVAEAPAAEAPAADAAESEAPTADAPTGEAPAAEDPSTDDAPTADSSSDEG